MGKIRVKTIGIEEDEKDQKKKAKAKAEAKRIEAAKKLGADTKAQESKSEEAQKLANTDTADKSAKTHESSDSVVPRSVSRSSADESEAKSAKKQSKYKAKTSKKSKPHSSNYLTMSKLVDKNKKYTIDEALKILNSANKLKFDETIELHINTNEKGVSGNLTLPHGTGKKAKIEIADHATDPKHLEELIKKIEGGSIDFDILIATPDTMSHLARVARFLGPKGLMPNPKNGTISPKPKEAIKKFEGGQINFKTEAKAPIIHLSVGKLSFGEKDLNANITTVLQAVQTKNIKNVTLKSTMSPGIKISI